MTTNSSSFVGYEHDAPSGAGDLWTDESAPPPPAVAPVAVVLMAGPAVAIPAGGIVLTAAAATLAIAILGLAGYSIYTTWTNGADGYGTIDTEDAEPWPDDGTDYELLGGKKIWDPYGEDETTEVGVIPAGPDLEDQTTRPVVDVTIEDPEEAEGVQVRGLSTDQIEGLVQSLSLALDDFGLQDNQGIFQHSGGGAIGGSGDVGNGTWTLGSDGHWVDGRGEGTWEEAEAPVGNVMLVGGHSNGTIIELPPNTPPTKLVVIVPRVRIHT